MTHPTAHIEAIRASIAIRGTLPTAALLGVNRESVIRLLAGLPVRAGTLALVRQNLGLLSESEGVRPAA